MVEELETVTVKRVYLPNNTLGSFYFRDKMLCKSMELRWQGNRKGISCIPEMTYLCTKEPPIPANDPQGRKERPYWHFRIHDVPGRSGILIHLITYVKDLQGCIGTGMEFRDFNKDGVLDMAGSTKALEILVKELPDRFWLKITKK
jgi:hypothetical protein